MTRLALLALIAVLAASDTAAQERRFLGVGRDTVFARGSISDDILLNPSRLAVADDRIYVFDSGGQALKAFDTRGELLWTFGRSGGGPGEFRRVRALATGLDGSALIVDNSNVRLTVVDRDGRMQREVSLRALEDGPEQVLQLAPDTFLIWAFSRSGEPLALVDGTGTVIERAPVPFAIAPRVPFLGAQARLANDVRRPGSWVYAFSFVDHWRVMDRLRAASSEFRWIESVPVPEVTFEDHGERGLSAGFISAVQAARSAAVVDDVLLVLFHGRQAESRRVVDLYRLGDGQYLGSILLPGIASEIAATRTQLIILMREPWPQLVSLRLDVGAPAR